MLVSRNFWFMRVPVMASLTVMMTVSLGWTAPARARDARADAVRPESQGRGGGGSQNPACAVLTTEEVKSITGFSGYDPPSPGDSPGQGAGGGASCQFSAPVFPTVDAKGNVVRQEGPLLSIVLIDGKNYTKTMTVGRGCRKEPVPGVGDEAFFEVCPDSRLARTPPLYVKAGNKDLILQMDVEKPDTDAALRPKVIALAKAAFARLR